MKKIWIMGTGTDVGKTVISAALLSWLRKNSDRPWGYLKPVISGATIKDGEQIPGDACFVASSAGLTESPMELVVHCYERALSPHFAARLEGKTFSTDTVLRRLESMSEKYDGVILESAGGVAVPLNYDGYTTADLASDVGGSVLLVATPGLGTISHILTAIEYLESRKVPVTGIVLNGTGKDRELEEDNLRTIENMSGIATVLAVPEQRVMDPHTASVLFDTPDYRFVIEKMIQMKI